MLGRFRKYIKVINDFNLDLDQDLNLGITTFEVHSYFASGVIYRMALLSDRSFPASCVRDTTRSVPGIGSAHAATAVTAAAAARGGLAAC